jgi:hypothetical protein
MRAGPALEFLGSARRIRVWSARATFHHLAGQPSGSFLAWFWCFFSAVRPLRAQRLLSPTVLPLRELRRSRWKPNECKRPSAPPDLRSSGRLKKICRTGNSLDLSRTLSPCISARYSLRVDSFGQRHTTSSMATGFWSKLRRGGMLTIRAMRGNQRPRKSSISRTIGRFASHTDDTARPAAGLEDRSRLIAQILMGAAQESTASRSLEPFPEAEASKQ